MKLKELDDSQLVALLQEKQDISSQNRVMQLGLKVTLNSAYGMIGNEYSRYYDVRIAEAITISGQLAIQWIKRKINEFLNEYLTTTNLDFIIAGDTDSVYITLAPFVEHMIGDAPMTDKMRNKVVDLLDEFASTVLDPFIEESYLELQEFMGAPRQRMHMSREVIADAGLWRAKKNYALNVIDSEGVRYAEPKLKIMGMESVRSSTPEMCRKAFKDVVKFVLTGTEAETQQYIKAFRQKFISAPLDDIAFPKGVNDLKKWHTTGKFISRTPYHVKGSIVYNRLLKCAKLTSKYREIKNSDKVKILYLRKGSPALNNTIAYPDILPPEFNLDPYVDKPLQYEKSFLNPALSVLDLVKWSHVKIHRLF